MQLGNMQSNKKESANLVYTEESIQHETYCLQEEACNLSNYSIIVCECICTYIMYHQILGHTVWCLVIIILTWGSLSIDTMIDRNNILQRVLV